MKSVAYLPWKRFVYRCLVELVEQALCKQMQAANRWRGHDVFQTFLVHPFSVTGSSHTAQPCDNSRVIQGAINTFIVAWSILADSWQRTLGKTPVSKDDLFSFIIKMPTMHRRIPRRAAFHPVFSFKQAF